MNLNELFIDSESEDNKYPIQSSLKEPDIWCQECIDNKGKNFHVQIQSFCWRCRPVITKNNNKTKVFKSFVNLEKNIVCCE